MATTKNKLIERYQTLVGSKAIEAIEPLILQSEAFIAKKNNVNKDDVTGILITAILDSDKKFPFPAVDVLLETNKKDVNNYVQFLWTYYKCPVNDKPKGITKPKKKKKLPDLNNPKPTDNNPPDEPKLPVDKPEVSISVSSQLVKKGDSVTITWKSTGADLVVDTDNFRVKDKTQVSGTTTIKTFNKSCTFEITVSNAAGTATDAIDVELEEDDIITNLADDIRKGLQDQQESMKAVLSKFKSPNFDKITDQLPANLKKDKRIYKGMPLDFELDFDFACYVLVDSKEINSTDLPYLEWAKNVSGQEQDVLIAHGKKVKKQVQLIGKQFKDLPMLHIPAVETDFKPKNANKQPTTGGSSPLNIQPPSIGNKLNDKSKKVADLVNTENPILKLIVGIQKTVETILTNLSGQSKDTKKVQIVARREQEKKRRLLKESLLETPGKFLMNATEKMLAPVKSILDRIINFLVFALLGKALISLYEWTKDPKNKDKVDTIVRFLKDWWPTLLGAFILFGTGFGKLIRSSIGLIISGTKKLAMAIPSLIKFLNKLSPRGKAIAAVVATGAGIYAANKLNESKPQVGTPKESPNAEPVQKPQGASAGRFYSAPVRGAVGGGLITQIKSHPAMGYTHPQTVNINEVAFADGGLIHQDSGVEITGAGKDTNLIAAQPGEVVISKSAVDYFGGPDFFLKLNAVGGGTNQPKFANNIQMQVGGGIVGSKVKPNLLTSSQLKSPKPATTGSTLSQLQSSKPATTESTLTANKKLTTAFNLPAVNIATNKLKKDEALSSLTRGNNDFIKPGQKSVVSNTPWNKLKDSTPIYSYLDSKNVPTIGWGATFYDSLFTGNRQVKMGDVITKKQADNTFKMQVLDLANNYSNKIKYWPMMTDNQRAGLLMMGFNAPNAPIGSYRKLTGALNAGDTPTAVKELQRDGPNQERIDTERKLLMSGPQNLRTAPNNFIPFKRKEEAKLTPPKQPTIFESIKNQFNKVFNVKPTQVSANIQTLSTQSPQINPLQPMTKTSFVNLPSMVVDSNNVTLPSQKSTGLPDFPSVSFAIEERMSNASTYGIG